MTFADSQGIEVRHAWEKSFGRNDTFDEVLVRHYVTLLGKESVLDAVRLTRGAMQQASQQKEARRDRFAYFINICRNRAKSGGGNILRQSYEPTEAPMAPKTPALKRPRSVHPFLHPNRVGINLRPDREDVETPVMNGKPTIPMESGMGEVPRASKTMFRKGNGR